MLLCGSPRTLSWWMLDGRANGPRRPAGCSSGAHMCLTSASVKGTLRPSKLAQGHGNVGPVGGPVAAMARRESVDATVRSWPVAMFGTMCMIRLRSVVVRRGRRYCVNSRDRGVSRFVLHVASANGGRCLECLCDVVGAMRGAAVIDPLFRSDLLRSRRCRFWGVVVVPRYISTPQRGR